MQRHSAFAGVLGWPLEHTLSPVIQNAGFRRLNLDWVYLAWPVAPADLPDAIAGLRALGAIGANVTMPHKETVIAYLDDLSEDARAVGAVNTIHFSGGRAIGHNTDITGFRDFLTEDAGVGLAGLRALVVGAGGAARAVVRALDTLGVTAITIVARNEDQAASVAPLASSAETCSWAEAGAATAAADVIVNATPLGMNDEELPTAQALRANHVVIDLIYDPPETPLIRTARSVGARAWSGLGMLVHQAASSLEIWTGQPPPLEAMSAAAIHALANRRPIR